MVSIAIIGLLMAILVPAMIGAMEQAKRIRCRGHLKGLYESMMIYANDNNGRPPMAAGTEGTLDAVGSARNVRPDATTPTPVSATLWLLVKTQRISPAMFVCPSAVQTRDTASAFDEDVWDFAAEGNLSYAMQYPYGASSYYAAGAASPSDMPVLADRGPFFGDGGDLTAMPADSADSIDRWLAEAANRARVNSANHNGVGQNVVFADGHADWADRPTVGVRDDNMYTVQGAGGGEVDRLRGQTPADGGVKAPANNLDTVLVY